MKIAFPHSFEARVLKIAFTTSCVPTRRGARIFSAFHGMSSGTFRLQVDHILAEGDLVVVLCTDKAQRGNLSNYICHKHLIPSRSAPSQGRGQVRRSSRLNFESAGSSKCRTAYNWIQLRQGDYAKSTFLAAPDLLRGPLFGTFAGVTSNHFLPVPVLVSPCNIV